MSGRAFFIFAALPPDVSTSAASRAGREDEASRSSTLRLQRLGMMAQVIIR